MGYGSGKSPVDERVNPVDIRLESRMSTVYPHSMLNSNSHFFIIAKNSYIVYANFLKTIQPTSKLDFL